MIIRTMCGLWDASFEFVEAEMVFVLAVLGDEKSMKGEGDKRWEDGRGAILLLGVR